MRLVVRDRAIVIVSDRRVLVFCFKERIIRASLMRFLTSAGKSFMSLPRHGKHIIEPLASAVVTRLLRPFGAAVVAGFGIGSRHRVGCSCGDRYRLQRRAAGRSELGCPALRSRRRALRLCYRTACLGPSSRPSSCGRAENCFVTLIRDDAEVRATATKLPVTSSRSPSASPACSTPPTAPSKPVQAVRRRASLLRLGVF